MPNIGIITKPKALPSMNARTNNLDALVIGGGKNAFDFGRKGFIRRSGLSTSTISSFGNGSEVINQVKVTNFQPGRQGVNVVDASEVDKLPGNNLIAIVERVVYVGSVATANILPGGSAITESEWSIIGDFYSHVDSDGSDVELNEIVNWRHITNLSAGTVDLIIHAYVRYIINNA